MLILASASEARRALLEQINVEHSVMVSEINEDNFYHENIKELVQILAAKKAESVVSRLSSDDNLLNYRNKASAILGCDSLFEFNGQAFGKPKSSEEAIERLKEMSSNTGIIHTGHCFIYRKENRSNLREERFNGILKGVVSTKISFSILSPIEISKYVNTEEPMKCAGGFSIDGKGAIFIDSIEGCYSNVIGLSLPWLKKAFNVSSLNLIN